MSHYDFSSLNSHDLELLVCDLWNAEAESLGLRFRYKAFAAGKDRGIDIVYDDIEENQNKPVDQQKHTYHTIGQVKHYHKSGFSKLKYDLENTELPKLGKLEPKTYKIATSLSLTLTQQEQLVGLLTPYLKTVHDIYDATELNLLLASNPAVLERHFKLWFSGTAQLQKLLNHEIISRSMDFKDNLLRKLRLYVTTPSFNAARERLRRTNVVIITGEPGSGKTTLAELLIAKLLTEKYEVTHIVGDINEVERVFVNDDRKQLFYFDDFLGHNALEIARAKASEAAFIYLLARIKRSANKKLVLTTRSFILNAAVDESERMRRQTVAQHESLLALTDYSVEIRRELLRNHVEESQMPQAYKDILHEEHLVDFLCKHRSFYPRSIEYITNPEHLTGISPEDFARHVLDIFTDPAKIWKHAYERQIDHVERLLLHTLLTFRDHAIVTDLEHAFRARLDYEAKNFNYIAAVIPYNNILKRMENGFITIRRYIDESTEEPGTYVEFINPSLIDFLIGSVKVDMNEVGRMAEAALYTQQLANSFFPLQNGGIDNPSATLLSHYVAAHPEQYIHNDTDYFVLALIIIRYWPSDERYSVAGKLLQNIDNWMACRAEFDALDYFAKLIHSETTAQFVDTISKLGARAFGPVITQGFLEDVLSLDLLMREKYDLDLINIFSQNTDFDWDQHFTMAFEATFDAIAIERKQDEITRDEAELKHREFLQLKRRLADAGIVIDFHPADHF